MPELNFTKTLLLDVVYVDAVVMFATIELVNPYTRVSQVHELEASPDPHE